ncbi:MAG: hypothetical protein IJJ34_03670 [Clostridia bacterium]|nr:hypothetical protein [Clostridia bacterium]
MSYKRAMWTSGYTYIATCSYCGSRVRYTDRDLGYRAWYPNGFVYCPRCKKPIRHNEFFALNPDGSRVYATQEQADRAVNEGYLKAAGFDRQIQPAEGTAYCTNCGRPYIRGTSSYCSGCGKKLD